ncbi:MAG: BamA/TamA family outer membrane protein, partial [Bacteroidales bacterium]
MQKVFLKTGLVIVFISILISGCSIKKYVNKNEHLVKSYKIDIKGNYDEISRSELKTFLRPKPNTKTFFFRTKLYNYYKYQAHKTKLRGWLNKHFGEPPAYYNIQDAELIVRSMNRYLNNTGFFGSTITYNVDFTDKFAKVNFTVLPAVPYRIKTIAYDIKDTVLRRLVYRKLDKSLIKSGDIYNAYVFDDERDRISNDLRNIGYYFFNRNYIQFVVDTNLLERKMNVNMVITNIKTPDPGKPGAFLEEPHHRYRINKVFVNPEYNPAMTMKFDTIVHTIDFWQDTNTYRYYFLYGSKLNIQPVAFNSALKIKPGKYYSANNVQLTYRKLFNYQIIRTANITFDTIGTYDPLHPDNHLLNARMMFQDNELNAFSAELEGTNSSGDLGIRGNLVITNRNIFRRAEVLRVRLKGGTEAQTISASTGGATSNSLFNTLDFGFDGAIFFPRFVFPIRLDKFNQRYIPNTNINFGYSYQLKSYYSRNITNLDIGYSWNTSKVTSHILTPINLNYVSVQPSATFDSILNSQPNRRLREQYSDHMIAGLNYSFIFNNQDLMVLTHFNYLRFNLETSGNLLYWINSLSGSVKSDSGYYNLLGVRYSQYIRASIDFRHYVYFFNKTNSLVFRFLAGAGVPYKNSVELPYEKGFYAGGANDMRGWQFKSLGPGGYSESTDYERVGDIQLEGNVEYRFPIYSFFKGALFADIGNVWTYRNSTTFPGGQFEFNTFYKELAVDAGFGFRFDF